MESPKAPTNATTEAEFPGAQPILGLLLNNRYLIESVLGRGGLGVVYLARDRQLVNRPVVIKVLTAQHENEKYDAWFHKKFKQEMEALARINHSGVVGVLDTGEMPDGRPYLVMQYVEGYTLHSVIGGREMEFDRVAQIVRQIGQALAAAHEKGVFHRDLKPENIMLEDLGGGLEHVKLIDFGVARIMNSQFSAGADTTWIAGTPPYMAPEQLRGKPTAESDIYSFGAVAYEMLTGQPPFKPGSAVDLYELQRSGAITKPKELRKNLPDTAQYVLLKALSFDAKNRYESARELGDDLAAALSGEPLPSELYGKELRSGPATVVGDGRLTSPDNTGIIETHQTEGRLRINWISTAAVSIFLLIGASAIWFIYNGLRKAEPERSFAYWVMVQKYREGKPYESPFRLMKEMNFERDYHVRLHVAARQSGFFYVINEGPEPVNGLPAYVLLFPTPTYNNGQAQVIANQEIAIPEQGDGIFFDKEQGVEKIWLIWAAQSLPEIESVKGVVNTTERGAISRPDQIYAIRDFLAKQSRASTQKDEVSRQTLISAKGNVIVHLINLEHN